MRIKQAIKSRKKLYYKLVFVSLLGCACGGTARFPNNDLRKREVVSESSDLRYLYSEADELNRRIKNNLCLLDARGLIENSEGLPVYPVNVTCNGKRTVASICNEFKIDLTKIRSSQVRVVKRNEIFQTERFVALKPPNQLERLKSIELEKGDVMAFLPHD